MVSIKALEKELQLFEKGQIVAIIVKAQQYVDVNIKILETLLNKSKLSGVYVTVNRPYDNMLKLLKENKINTDNLFFIDAITKTVAKEPERTNNCLFIGSPEDLTSISIALDQALPSLKSKERFLFLDSLSTLFIYNQIGTVTKFAHFLSTKLRELQIIGVLITLEKETDERLLSQLTQFCDKVITVEG